MSSLPPIIQDYMQWWVCGAIVVLGLVAYGFRDLIRLSFTRVWAISSVCFAESVRRKIWLIAPLAIIGVVVVSQLQKPVDESDAIRQTIKFCLFATGLLVTITAIILACTNLPREIENRVIYTVCTKPTTRLEIVLGKILGFARVSALILIIMGLFTWGYLHLRSWRFDSGIRARLAATGEVDAVARPTLEYYRDAGLLAARKMAYTDDMQIFSRLPEDQGTKRFMTAGDGDFIVPFDVTPADLVSPGVPPGADAPPGIGGFVVAVQIGARPLPGVTPTPFAPTTQSTTNPATQAPGIIVQILDANQSSMFAAREVNNGAPIPIADLTGNRPTLVILPPNAAEQVYKPGADLKKPMRLYIQVLAGADGYEYFADRDPVVMFIPPANEGQPPRTIKPMPDPANKDKFSPAMFRGREGTAGQQLRGGNSDNIPVAVYHFNDAPPANETGDVTFEFKCGIERGGADSDSSDDSSTLMSVSAQNRDNGQASPPISLALEANRQTYFKVPAQYVSGGNFDVRIQCKSNGNYLGLFPSSLGMVRATQGFDVNLIKSLFIMWLMAILVITVAIFTSTFLSWPTAIVLTLVILLGRWGVEQLGDATQPGIGHMVAQDMGFTDPNKMKVVSSVTEALAGGLNMLAKVLPDITQFAATEDIERGMVVPMSKMADALAVLACYGLATLTLAYVRLTFTEVAP